MFCKKTFIKKTYDLQSGLAVYRGGTSRHEIVIAIQFFRVVGVTRMIEPKIGRKIVKDWIIK